MHGEGVLLGACSVDSAVATTGFSHPSLLRVASSVDKNRDSLAWPVQGFMLSAQQHFGRRNSDW